MLETMCYVHGLLILDMSMSPCSQSVIYKYTRLMDDSVSDTQLVSITFLKQVSNLH